MSVEHEAMLTVGWRVEQDEVMRKEPKDGPYLMSWTRVS